MISHWRVCGTGSLLVWAITRRVAFAADGELASRRCCGEFVLKAGRRVASALLAARSAADKTVSLFGI